MKKTQKNKTLSLLSPFQKGLWAVLWFGIKISAQARYDSVKIPPAKLPQPPSKTYTGKDFTYEEPLQEPGFLERLWRAFWEFIARMLNKLFDWNLRADSVSGRQALWFALSFLLAVLVVAGFIFFWKKFRRTLGRGGEEKISVEEAEKRLYETDFDQLIENARAAQNFPIAVRFLYLKMLKFLSEKQLIDYQYQKTNYEYAYEIKDENLRNLFREISFLFDYCRYGEYRATDGDFRFAEEKYREIETAIK